VEQSQGLSAWSGTEFVARTSTVKRPDGSLAVYMLGPQRAGWKSRSNARYYPVRWQDRWSLRAHPAMKTPAARTPSQVPRRGGQHGPVLCHASPSASLNTILCLN
jgi:hypothetical protein